MRLLLFPVVLCTTLAAKATDHYVSPAGNDASNGTSANTAWRTIDRVNQSTYQYQAGDRILFQRGGVYRGTVDVAAYGTSTAPVTIGAYGTGAAPVISGSVLVTDWTPYNGNIWKAEVGTDVNVKYLFANGQLMTLARFPNSGWLRNDQGTTTSLHDADLTQPNGYWNGATLVVRGSNWNYDLATVSGFFQGTLSFPTIYDGLGNDDWGYFLCNKLSELDQPGEWFFDQSAGVLYFQAPGNADPTSLVVEAATRDRGIHVFWHRSHVVISGLAFQHQTGTGIYVEDADHVTVDSCTFSDAYRGIESIGHSNTYSNSSFERTYATAVHVLDDSTIISDNTLSDVAMVPGSGETSWGYMGIRSNGTGVVIRGNRLQNIGYIGILAEHNALVERNVVVNATAILNDGGGIAFDNADGMVVQDNIVRDCVGSLESSAPSYVSYVKICNGIYFGNNGVSNTTVQRNTVFNCKGAGIHVDHTMNATGNAIKDNVLFNNDVQLSLSDFSNNNGPSAVPPYYLPNYDDVYSGNVMYSLAKDQPCMRQTDCYGAVPVDFGMFADNRYFNPYDELSIAVVNNMAGGVKHYALERWQADLGEDAGSTRSPLRLSEFSTLQELSGNMVQNGDFDNDVDGWTGWPTNAQVTRVTDRLDSGALKAYLPDNSIYPSFFLQDPELFNVQAQDWYRLSFSIQGDVPGDLITGIKGASQSTTPYRIWQRQVPFDGERRDLVMYFQDTLSDQAHVQFENQWTEPMYYLDNVELKKVSVQPLDPSDRNKLFVNDQATEQTFTLPDGCWKDVDGNSLPSSITVAPYSSLVAYKVEGPDCSGASPGGSVRVRVFLGGALDNGSELMRDDLHEAGLVPGGEPYSAFGYVLENAGAVMAPTVMQATGEQAVVDWVVLELRNDDASYSVAESRAALVCRNGTVIDPDGNEFLAFDGPVAGKLVSVRHRNHLGAMCTTALVGDGQLVDLTSPSTTTYGMEAEKNIGGRMALWPGNVDIDTMVKYTGAANDRDGILMTTGGTVPTNTVAGYLDGDVNMNGYVSYTGAYNDRDAVLTTIGGGSTTSIRTEQLP